jgi:hypothetical protein
MPVAARRLNLTQVSAFMKLNQPKINWGNVRLCELHRADTIGLRVELDDHPVTLTLPLPENEGGIRSTESEGVGHREFHCTW